MHFTQLLTCILPACIHKECVGIGNRLELELTLFLIAKNHFHLCAARNFMHNANSNTIQIEQPQPQPTNSKYISICMLLAMIMDSFEG